MALVKDTNSYCTVVEADAYFADRLDVAAWISATPEQKGQSLVTATALLDTYSWLGTVFSEGQSLMFPRNGAYYDTSKGVNVEMNPVPLRILRATMELAYHLLNNDGLLDDTGGVSNLSIDSISLSTIKNPSSLPIHVRRLIRPLRVQQSRSW